MKDLLGREIKAGDTVVLLQMKYDYTMYGPGGRAFLIARVVKDASDFAVLLDDGVVYSNPKELALVDANRNVWGAPQS